LDLEARQAIAVKEHRHCPEFGPAYNLARHPVRLSHGQATRQGDSGTRAEIIGETPGGIRYSALVEKIATANPETPKNTIHGSVWDLDKTFSGEVLKPSRGLFTFRSAGAEEGPLIKPSPVPAPRLSESDFYESFAVSKMI
jgi:hypothetical protein